MHAACTYMCCAYTYVCWLAVSFCLFLCGRCLSSPDNSSPFNECRASWPSSSSPPPGHTVKVTNMPKHLTKEDLSGMLKKDSTTQVLKINVVEADVAKPNHAFVVCPTREAANSIIRCLHERAMGQLSLTAQLHNGVLRMLFSVMYTWDTTYVCRPQWPCRYV